MSAGPETLHGPDSLRQRAEERLDQGSPAAAQPVDGPGRVAHELQVHQAELEIQNEELRRSRLALEVSERRWRALFHSAPVPFLVIGADGLVLEANGAAGHLLSRGHPLVGAAASRLAVPGEEIALHRTLSRVLASRESQRVEVRLRGPGNAPVPVDLVAGPLEEPEGIRALVLVQDVSERVSSEAERARLAGQVERLQRLDALGQMAGAVAHEINNVLAIVLAAAQEAEIGGAEATGAIQEVLRAARRGRDLTTRLLGFSRVTPRQRQAVDVGALVREAAAFARRLSGGLVQVEEQHPPVPVHAAGDSTQIHQSVLNLALNALDAVGARGGRVVLRVEPVEVRPGDPQLPPGVAPGSFVRISVADDGPGFTADALEHAFEPFYTTKPQGKGTGLGLAMVWGVARDHGGFATVDSPGGQGATVAVLLPRAEGQVAPAPRVERSSAPGRGRALVVDDEPVLRRTLVRALERQGWTAAGAGSGEEALHWLAAGEDPPDVVLVDIQMPGMGGLETLRRIRADRPDLPVVLMSGYSDERVPDDLLGSSTMFLGKPFEVPEMLAVVERLGRRPKG